MENVKQHDVKDEAKEKHFQPELLDLEEAPLGRAGKLNPIKGQVISKTICVFLTSPKKRTKK